MSKIKVLVDLRANLGTTRDQFERNSCAAFAASDAHSSVRPDNRELSAEYAYYCALAKQGATDVDEGSTLETMVSVIENIGQPFETDWPYNPYPPADFASWAPPSGLSNLMQRESDLGGISMQQIYDWLDVDRAVIIGMRISSCWMEPTVDPVIDGGSNEQEMGGHAVLVVGHGEHEKERILLIRNSWGSNWQQDGHAWISEAYLAPRLMSTAVIKV